jgi:polyisoprenoid-binding protein YceI
MLRRSFAFLRFVSVVGESSGVGKPIHRFSGSRRHEPKRGTLMLRPQNSAKSIHLRIYFSVSRRLTRSFSPLYLTLAFSMACLSQHELHADPGYSARSGKIAFRVRTNIPFLTVSGSSSAVKGTAEAIIAGNAATIRNLNFEVDPKSLKTGMKIRDEHMYAKVFTAADGSVPPIVLHADQFQAKLNPNTSKWEGTLQAQLSIRGVTRPISFRTWGEKKESGAIVNAAATVRTSEFGVKKISYSGATVNDAVDVTVSNLRIEP